MRRKSFKRFMATLLVGGIILGTNTMTIGATELPATQQAVQQLPTAEFIMNAPIEYFESSQNPTVYLYNSQSIPIDLDNFDYAKGILEIKAHPKGTIQLDENGYVTNKEWGGQKYVVKLSKYDIISNNITNGHGESGCTLDANGKYCSISYKDGCEIDFEKRVFITETGQKIPFGNKFMKPITKSERGTSFSSFEEMEAYLAAHAGILQDFEYYILNNSVILKAYMEDRYTEDLIAARQRAFYSNDKELGDVISCYINERCAGLR